MGVRIILGMIWNKGIYIRYIFVVRSRVRDEYGIIRFNSELFVRKKVM